jgi:hypothetical protein
VGRRHNFVEIGNVCQMLEQRRMEATRASAPGPSVMVIGKRVHGSEKGC